MNLSHSHRHSKWVASTPINVRLHPHSYFTRQLLARSSTSFFVLLSSLFQFSRINLEFFYFLFGQQKLNSAVKWCSGSVEIVLGEHSVNKSMQQCVRWGVAAPLYIAEWVKSCDGTAQSLCNPQVPIMCSATSRALNIQKLNTTRWICAPVRSTKERAGNTTYLC